VCRKAVAKHVPLKEQMISPGAIFDSELLELVAESGML